MPASAWGVADAMSTAKRIEPSATAEPASVSRSQDLYQAAKVERVFEALSPSKVTAGTRLLRDNVESWRSMWHVVESAETELDATYFILERDVFGMAFLGAMLKKAREGVQVRLMADAVGDFLGKRGVTQTARGQDYLQELVETGNADVRVYAPIHKKMFFPLRRDMPKYATGASNHDKIVRSDRWAHAGGRNMSREYFGDPTDQPNAWRDSDFLLEGRGASAMFERAFEDEFERDGLCFHVGKNLLGNWRRRDIELLGAYLMMDTWMNAKPVSDAAAQRLRTDPEYKRAVAAQVLERAIARLPEVGIERAPGWLAKRKLKKLAEQLVGHTRLRGASRGYDPRQGMEKDVELKILDKTSAAGAGHDDINRGIGRLAMAARKSLIIETPYLVLTEKAVRALEAAAERGVQITVVTNSASSTDSSSTQAFFLEDWPEIMARVPNMKLFTLTGEQRLHSKAAVADDRVAWVGSYNLDLISEKINGETVSVAKSPAIAKQLSASMRADLLRPELGAHEYRIARDAFGDPLFHHGEPVVLSGGQDHVSPKQWAGYRRWRKWVRWARERFEWLRPVRHPKALTHMAERARRRLAAGLARLPGVSPRQLVPRAPPNAAISPAAGEARTENTAAPV